MTPRLKAALVIDALPAIGGAEKVLIDAMELLPEAPIYTLIYNHRAFAGTTIATRRVVTSFIDRLPGAHTHYRNYLPLMPRAIQQFELGEFDMILSFSYAVAHGIVVRTGQTHLSYTHTPMRYAWGGIHLNGEERSGNRVQNWIFGGFRIWDAAAVAGVDSIAAVSAWIADRVRSFYRRESTVIYPPVDVERFSPDLDRGNYYLTVSRLVRHKRIDLIVGAFNRLGLPLLVVGEGPERLRLERQAQKNVRFLGFCPDREVADLLGRGRAFISAGEEDFGIAVVEAQAAGCPVIAYRRGGTLETVTEGHTGLFFDDPCEESLIEAVVRFERRSVNFDPSQIAASVQRFNKRRFQEELGVFLGMRGQPGELEPVTQINPAPAKKGPATPAQRSG